MSATTDHAVDTHGLATDAADGHAVGAHGDHPTSDAIYWKIFAILVVITAAEVATTEIELGAAFLPLLLGLMVIKFAMVVWFFMHLKYDARLFGKVFYAGLLLAVMVYAGVLSTFKFFNG
jgi:cytochrome c oxidase subunit IV